MSGIFYFIYIFNICSMNLSLSSCSNFKLHVSFSRLSKEQRNIKPSSNEYTLIADSHELVRHAAPLYITFPISSISWAL